MRRLTPIEMMVDKACGFDRAAADASPLVKMLCPVCHKRKLTTLEKHEPKGTATIVLTCPDCLEAAADIEPAVYLDANGKQLHAALASGEEKGWK